MKKSLPVLTAIEIAAATKGALFQGRADHQFQGLSTDSRSVLNGEIFVPLIGERYNGHDFLSDVVQKGASGLIVQRSELGKLGSLDSSTIVIIVEDTLKALGDIAKFWRKHFSIPVVGITGSSGKTTTKEMAARIVEQEKRLLKNEGNLNNLIGLPLTILKMDQTHEASILEMGTNRRGEIARLTEIANPTIGLITNIGSAHLEGFKNLETVREEKGDLYKGLANTGMVVVNSDNSTLKIMANQRKGPVFTYGIENEADVRAVCIRKEGFQKLCFDLVMGGEKTGVTLGVPGRHNIYNALAAAAISRCLGITGGAIKTGLEAFRPVSGRMEIIRLRNGSSIINDAYNANPDSVEAALNALIDLKGQGRAIVVLGDMLELGRQAEKLHKQVGESLASKGVERLFLSGEFSRAVAEGAEKGGLRGDQIFMMGSTDQVASAVQDFLQSGDWVLIKASRRLRMEEVTQKLIKVIGITE